MVHKSKTTALKLFVSHASEDKNSIARPLARALVKLGHDVWYDEFVLKMGDSLSRSIDDGLATCDFGVVILSAKFFSKRWTQEELAGLTAREMSNSHKRILPVWHKIDAEMVRKFSPMLADRVGIPSSLGLGAVVRAISSAIEDDQRMARRFSAVYKSPQGGEVRVMYSPNNPSPHDPKAFDERKIDSMVKKMELALKSTRLKKE